MKRCTVCKERFQEEEGRVDEEGKFVCLQCADESGDVDSAECVECGDVSEELKRDGICPNCGAEADAEEPDEEADEKE